MSLYRRSLSTRLAPLLLFTGLILVGRSSAAQPLRSMPPLEEGLSPAEVVRRIGVPPYDRVEEEGRHEEVWSYQLKGSGFTAEVSTVVLRFREGQLLDGPYVGGNVPVGAGKVAQPSPSPMRAHGAAALTGKGARSAQPAGASENTRQILHEMADLFPPSADKGSAAPPLPPGMPPVQRMEDSMAVGDLADAPN